jgi:hypothetical protein
VNGKKKSLLTLTLTEQFARPFACFYDPTLKILCHFDTSRADLEGVLHDSHSPEQSTVTVRWLTEYDRKLSASCA